MNEPNAIHDPRNKYFAKAELAKLTALANYGNWKAVSKNDVSTNSNNLGAFFVFHKK